MIIEIPDELVDRALDAVGLSVIGARSGIVRTILSPGCVDCKTKSAFVIDGIPYCARHAREHLELRRDEARGLA
jgi:hypothetical protein